jgi:hypothetical protein
MPVRRKQDSFWMDAKFPGVASDGTLVKRGDRVLYFPNTKTMMVGKEADKEWKEFQHNKQDDDFGRMAASAQANSINAGLGLAFRSLAIGCAKGFAAKNQGEFASLNIDPPAKDSTTHAAARVDFELEPWRVERWGFAPTGWVMFSFDFGPGESKPEFSVVLQYAGKQVSLVDRMSMPYPLWDLGPNAFWAKFGKVILDRFDATLLNANKTQKTASPSYQEYLDRKKQEGKKPLSQGKKASAAAVKAPGKSAQLKDAVVKLAKENPELRQYLVPIIRQAAKMVYRLEGDVPSSFRHKENLSWEEAKRHAQELERKGNYPVDVQKSPDGKPPWEAVDSDLWSVR